MMTRIEFTTQSGSRYFVTETVTQGRLLGQIAPEGSDYYGKPQRILVEHAVFTLPVTPEVGQRFRIVGTHATLGRPNFQIDTSPVVSLSVGALV